MAWAGGEHVLLSREILNKSSQCSGNLWNNAVERRRDSKWNETLLQSAVATPQEMLNPISPMNSIQRNGVSVRDLCSGGGEEGGARHGGGSSRGVAPDDAEPSRPDADRSPHASPSRHRSRHHGTQRKEKTIF
eukprot:2717243-Amphidinium_carterae.1